MDILELKGTELRVRDSMRDQLDALAKETGNSSDREMHLAMAAALYGPIDKLARYQEWAAPFFMQEKADPQSMVRVVQDEYTVVAIETSPDGRFFFNRPGYTYATIEWDTVDAGLEISWRQLRFSGWPLLEKKMQEVAEELARKRDARRKAAMDTAVESISGHQPTVATDLTKAAVDAIIKSARQAGWDVTMVAVNSGTIMDMGDWVVGSASMWEIMQHKAAELFTKLWVSNYGGLDWYASKDVPSDTLYFTTGADRTGWEWTNSYKLNVSEVDVKQKVDRHAWEEDKAIRVDNPYALWRLTIT